jgi:heterodisulfide reductase subunit B
MERFGYYPGCCLKTTAREYEDSLLEVCAALDLELVELDDWNCCAPVPFYDGNGTLAAGLAARNLVLAGRAGRDLVVPCPGCYRRLRDTALDLEQKEVLRGEVERLLGSAPEAPVAVRSAVEVLWRAGAGRITLLVRRPLTGLRVACYPGCRLSRPARIAAFPGGRHAAALEELAAATGAEPVRWSGAAECCGAALGSTRPELVRGLVDRLLTAAQRAGAEVLVTACPVCHANLEWRRGRAWRSALPVLYFTELLGLALGLDRAPHWLRAHLVDARPLLRRLGA